MYEFRYTASGGPGDGLEGSVQVSLSDEQSKRLKAYIQTDSSDGLTWISPIKDIYDRVRNRIAAQEMECMDLDYIREFDEEDEEGDIDLDQAMENYLDAINLTIYLPE